MQPGQLISRGFRRATLPLVMFTRARAGQLTARRYEKFGLPEGARQLHWLFLATLPNSGSTALAKLIESSSHVRLLYRNGEGQWLLPDISRHRLRWQPDHAVDYRRVRAVWVKTALARGTPPMTIFEKSPSNLVRMDPLMNLFKDDAKVDLILLSRDPVAVCASWAKRYPPSRLAKTWMMPSEVTNLDDEATYYRSLGGICGTRMGYLAALKDRSVLWLRYEDLTEDTEGSVRKLKQSIAGLEDVNPAHMVKVKDYAPQPLRNMNAEQRARLSDAQLRWVLEGLAPHEESLRKLSYDLT